MLVDKLELVGWSLVVVCSELGGVNGYGAKLKMHLRLKMQVFELETKSACHWATRDVKRFRI